MGIHQGHSGNNMGIQASSFKGIQETLWAFRPLRLRAFRKSFFFGPLRLRAFRKSIFSKLLRLRAYRKIITFLFPYFFQVFYTKRQCCQSVLVHLCVLILTKGQNGHGHMSTAKKHGKNRQRKNRSANKSNVAWDPPQHVHGRGLLLKSWSCKI